MVHMSGVLINDTDRSVIIFGVDKSLSSYSENCKNNISILVKGPTFGINGSFDSPEKIISISFTKANTKFCLSWHYNAYNSYLFINGKQIIKFKTDNKNVNFPNRFCLGNITDGFNVTESREVFLRKNLYDFLVGYNSIDKFDILNIHQLFHD